MILLHKNFCCLFAVHLSSLMKLLETKKWFILNCSGLLFGWDLLESVRLFILHPKLKFHSTTQLPTIITTNICCTPYKHVIPDIIISIFSLIYCLSPCAVYTFLLCFSFVFLGLRFRRKSVCRSSPTKICLLFIDLLLFVNASYSAPCALSALFAFKFIQYFLQAIPLFSI